MGYMYLAAAMISLTVLGVSYKLSDLLGCDKRQANLFFFLSGAVVAAVWAVASRSLVPIGAAIGIGVVFGIMTFFNILAFRVATTKGKISTSWTIVQLALVIPVFASIFIWHETPTMRHYLGFTLTFVAIILLGMDMGKGK
jgi:uncharacterized membrane protein